MIPLVVGAVARLVLPVALTVSAALLVKGYKSTGDGFSAGALSAVALGLQLVASGPVQRERRPLLRHGGMLAIVGLAIALTVAFAPILWGDPILTHIPPPDAEVVHVGSIELISAFAYDVGIFLLVLGGVGAILSSLAPGEEQQAT